MVNGNTFQGFGLNTTKTHSRRIFLHFLDTIHFGRIFLHFLSTFTVNLGRNLGSFGQLLIHLHAIMRKFIKGGSISLPLLRRITFITCLGAIFLFPFPRQDFCFLINSVVKLHRTGLKQMQMLVINSEKRKNF